MKVCQLQSRYSRSARALVHAVDRFIHDPLDDPRRSSRHRQLKITTSERGNYQTTRDLQPE